MRDLKVLQAFDYANHLLKWFDKNGRVLPWRLNPQDPYKVMVSEFMLQQTTVKTVIPYFIKKKKKWPTLEAFSSASEEVLLTIWQGLGYYARAKNLLKAVFMIMKEQNGVIPNCYEKLKNLPGFGPYTAAAVASIAFDEPAAIVDGNVIRVLSRVFGVAKPMPAGKQEIMKIAQDLTPAVRAGDYASAIMDLGATICRSSKPLCNECPWQEGCFAYHQGQVHLFPMRAAKPVRPVCLSTAFWIQNSEGKVWIQKRSQGGMLANLWELPHTGFSVALARQQVASLDSVAKERPRKHIQHVFSHFTLNMAIVEKKACDAMELMDPDNGEWVDPDGYVRRPMASLMKKVFTSMRPPREK
ncbi:MAG: A/G-specific adenine glycosylase [Alphaproteobacteria bacterium]|nr:A/G-specific adenine glycosylase [Alphaproteobacteria bacterium]